VLYQTQSYCVTCPSAAVLNKRARAIKRQAVAAKYSSGVADQVLDTFAGG
jgi:hypothetical protein